MIKPQSCFDLDFLFRDGKHYDGGILFLGILTKNSIHAGSTMIIATLFTIDKKRKQCKGLSAVERIMKMWCLYTMEFCLSIQKKMNNEQINGWN